METLASYVFWTSIYLAVLGIVQWSIPRRSATPAHNRWFILIGLFAALMLGLFVLVPEQHSINSSTVSAYLLPEVVVGTSSGLEYSKQEIYEAFSTQRMLFYTSLGISFVLLLRLLASIIFLMFRIRFNRSVIRHGCTILPVKKQTSPFSFFGFVFIPESLLSDSNLHTILLHEKAHMLKKHSIDLIFTELWTVLFWFHPAVWYLRRELKMQHEYEADQYVINASLDKKAYQKLLLNLSFSGYNFPVANPFNYSPLKKRIMMMNKEIRKNRLQTVTGMLLILPLFFTIFMLQSFVPGPEEVPEPKEEREVIAVDQVGDEHEEDVIFTVVEEQPKFPGGEDARMQFMQHNLKYPEMAKEAGIQGTVFVSFVVEKDGSISNVKILRGLSAEVDKEAVRVVEAMPDWVPGRQRGEEVRVQFNMPIRFTLDEETDPDESKMLERSYLIIIGDEQHTIADRFDIQELNDIIPVEEIGHIEMLTGEEAKSYGYDRVIKISRKEELEFFRGE